MKSILLIGALALSLAANVWLVSSRAPSAPASSPLSATAPTADSTKSVPSQTTASPEKAVTWSSLHAGEDITKLVAGLRTAGFPASLIQRIALAQLNQQLAARRKQIYDADAGPLWKRSGPTQEQALALRSLDLQNRTLLQSMGLDPFTPEEMAGLVRQWSYLPQAKMLPLEKLNKDYDDLIDQLFGKNRPSRDSDLEAQLKLLNEEKRRDLAALLTPEELEEYDLRNSRAGTFVRSMVQLLDVSDADYRALFRIVQASDLAHPRPLGVPSSEQFEEQVAASTAMRHKIRAYLGDERFLKFLAAPNSDSEGLVRFATANPGVTVDQIFGLLDAQYSLARDTQKPGQSPEERQASINKWAADYRTKLAEQIGSDRLNALAKGNYGQLSMFLKREAPPPKN